MSQPRGRPFAPGNKAGRGRPQGSRNKATLESQALFAEYAGPITKKCIAEALKGEPVPMRLAMERVCPVQKERALEIKLPPIQRLNDVAGAAEAITAAVGKGKMTLDEGNKAMAMLESQCSILMKTDFDARLQALEKTVAEER